MKTQITADTIKFRHYARNAIRSFLDGEGFIELETPYLLSANTPDPFIDPVFASAEGFADRLLQLHTSPEIWLKKGLQLGLEKIYHMARVFRDDPLDKTHYHEFTMLEWYRVNATLDDLIHDAESIFGRTQALAKKHGLIEGGNNLEFVRADLSTLFYELAGINLAEVLRKIRLGDAVALQRKVSALGDYLSHEASFDDAFFHIMLKYIEPNLLQDKPIVISRWPLQLAALAKPCLDNPDFCDRFEIYFRGLEIANAYQECTDGEVLRRRFLADNLERKKRFKPIFAIDEAFLTCMRDLPETAGIALGIDRLFLAVLGKKEIAEVIFGYGDH